MLKAKFFCYYAGKGRIIPALIRRINIEKHGVSFKMAASAFFDPKAVKIDDDEYSQYEDRFIPVGVNKYDKLLTVCHCYRDDGNVVRIISARKPNQYEKEVYENGDAF